MDLEAWEAEAEGKRASAVPMMSGAVALLGVDEMEEDAAGDITVEPLHH